MNRFVYIIEYLPKRYSASPEQDNARRMCWDFKKGILSDRVRDAFISKVRAIQNDSGKRCMVCFIPASTKEKTILRFSRLSSALKTEGFDVEEHAVFNTSDREAEHINGKSDNPTRTFGFNESKIRERIIILIDDIFTRGRTFNQTAAKLKEMGAIDVIGLFLAKTVNPDYHQADRGSNVINSEYEPDVEDIYLDDMEFEMEYDQYPIYNPDEEYMAEDLDQFDPDFEDLDCYDDNPENELY